MIKDTLHVKAPGNWINDPNGFIYYKGNYHLLANIDGVERKFVISKNKEEFASIEQIGLANLTSDQLKAMVAKSFNL